MRWIRPVAFTLLLIGGFGMVRGGLPALSAQYGLRYGNPCISDKDCDPGTICFMWSDGSKTCEAPSDFAPGHYAPQIGGPTPQACHSTTECPGDTLCLTSGNTPPGTGYCIGGATGLHGVCSLPNCLP